MPETKPDLQFDADGVCSACRYYEHRPAVDWDERKKEFEALLGKYRAKGNNYDCIIPVSGGKDSYYQTIRILEHGHRPLCVNGATDKLSGIGRRNIEHLKALGVDFIEVTPNPKIRRIINRLALTHVGDISWPEHIMIFTVPVRIAVQFQIPLIIWGENSQNENGGPAAAAHNNVLTRRWLEEFGGLLGLRVSDLAGQSGIEEKDLIQYTYPTDEELARVGVTGLFLGHYFPWDGHDNARVAAEHGFESYPKMLEGSIVNYENLDNLFMRVHDYFKFLKYGYDRATDWACLHIRRGRLTRAEAMTLVREHGGKFPSIYLGEPLENILHDIDMTMDEFIAVCDRFTNKKIFLTDAQGDLVKDEQGNLTKIQYDNET